MTTFSKEFSHQISEFTDVFATKKVFENTKTLLLGRYSRRTMCGCLRSVGLGQEKRFHKYHWVFSLAEWSPRQAAQGCVWFSYSQRISCGECSMFLIFYKQR